jgi:DNA polymerase III subunit delta'
MSAQWRREGRAAADAGDGAPPPRRLAAPLGQGEALQRWVGLARRLTLPHGFLVEGPRGVGKSTVMDWLTAALCCPSTLDADAPCGVCRTCTRVANAVHPDVHLLDLAHDEADRSAWKKSFYVIKVDQVRRAQQVLQQHAVEGRARVLVIADADCLEEEGQNALLKTLEEPGRATFLLLEATRPERLLPTVHSRVQRLRVRPLDDATLRSELRLRAPERAQHHAAAIAVAGGSLGQALLACTERAVQLHDLVQRALAEPDRLRPVALARAVLAGSGERRHEIDTARTFLWLLRAELARVRDALAAQASSSYPAASAEPWTTWLERTLAAERDLDLLIPAEQALTACLVSFAAG